MIKKIVFTIFLIIVFIALFALNVSAVALPTPSQPQHAEDMKGIVMNIIGTLKWVAFIAAVGVMIFLGLKYVSASVNEKAEIKNSLIAYAAGAMLIAGSFQIVQWLYAAFK